MIQETILTRQDKTRQDKTRQDKTRQDKIISLGYLGVGGQKGDIYATFGISPSLIATHYKDPIKVLVKEE